MSATLPSSTLCCAEEFCDAVVTVSVPGPAGPPGIQGESGTSGLAGLFVVGTLAQARAIPNSNDFPADPANVYLIMLGTDVPLNGYGGQFGWVADSNLTDNYSDTGGSVITPNLSSGPGRWSRVL